MLSQATSIVSKIKIESLHRYLIYEILHFLDISSIINFSQGSKSLNETTCKHEEGLNFVKQVLWKELGLLKDFDLERNHQLSISKEQKNDFGISEYEDLNYCKQVYAKVLRWWKPTGQRLFAFRSTGGIDEN